MSRTPRTGQKRLGRAFLASVRTPWPGGVYDESGAHVLGQVLGPGYGAEGEIASHVQGPGQRPLPRRALP